MTYIEFGAEIAQVKKKEARYLMHVHRRRAVLDHPGRHRCHQGVRLPDSERHLTTDNNGRFAAARTKAIADDRDRAVLIPAV
ncbi:hypothetical protein AB8Z38_17820 [Bradyrhizobium sp. LLZ17]|uniref:Transposase n=1 Tax=Bradyrhizobium sp. LLZ17 TaxID=3239388 RepID=A0AB39XSU3_9BRAD